MSKALELVQALRQQGFKAERDYLNRKLKAQFKSADVFAAKTLITLGESEVESRQVTVKNNQTREEVEVSLEKISQNFSEIFEKLGFNSRKTGQEPTPDLFLLQNDKNHKLFDKYTCQKEKDVLQ